MRTLMLAFASAFLLSACSEPDQSAGYDNTNRSYSGKTDTKPWEAPRFDGDKAAWERELAQRTTQQNEYSRTQ